MNICKTSHYIPPFLSYKKNILNILNFVDKNICYHIQYFGRIN